MPQEIGNSDLGVAGLDEYHKVIKVDFYSHYWEITRLSDATSENVIETMKEHLGRQGILKILHSDNGPHFFEIVQVQVLIST